MKILKVSCVQICEVELSTHKIMSKTHIMFFAAGNPAGCLVPSLGTNLVDCIPEVNESAS